MKAIWKYTLVTTDEQNVFMPNGSKILTVQIQHGEICLWAEVYSNLPPTDCRRIEIFGTGHEFDHHTERTYIGTVQMGGGALVFHVFERP